MALSILNLRYTILLVKALGIQKHANIENNRDKYLVN